MIFLSSNHFSTDLQIQDVVNVIEWGTETPANLHAAFPDLERALATLDGTSSWVDTEAAGLDPEYMCWVADWIEANTRITWWEGEPVIFEPGDEDEDEDDSDV